MTREEATSEHGQVWDTQELQEDYIVHSFCYGVVTVTRKSDNVRGTMTYTPSPRFYFGFRESR